MLSSRVASQDECSDESTQCRWRRCRPVSRHIHVRYTEYAATHASTTPSRRCSAQSRRVPNEIQRSPTLRGLHRRSDGLTIARSHARCAIMQSGASVTGANADPLAIGEERKRGSLLCEPVSRSPITPPPPPPSSRGRSGSRPLRDSPRSGRGSSSGSCPRRRRRTGLAWTSRGRPQRRHLPRGGSGAGTGAGRAREPSPRLEKGRSPKPKVAGSSPVAPVCCERSLFERRDNAAIAGIGELLRLL